MAAEFEMAVERDSLQIPKRRLLGMVAIAFVFASILVVCFVLPAEYHLDPTGVGHLTGVSRLAGPKRLTATEAVASSVSAGTAAVDANPGAPAVVEVGSSAGTSASVGAGTVRYYESGYRSDFVDIPLRSSDTGPTGSELEYKVRMKAGGTLVYSWTVPGIANPEEFYYDFHGEAPAKNAGAEGTVVEYRQATGSHSAGTLVAPFDGIFGWYVQNQSAKPVVMHLKISGFYELIASGQSGNEAGIKANVALPP
jgi:hypothetical protein